mmetsp:Transcript_24512/g.82690  ORF Transcript_24512/g.82690 Transcript_24512/m.82690 type:complete len:219 (-) Transcript_24512:175-831(-)
MATCSSSPRSRSPARKRRRWTCSGTGAPRLCARFGRTWSRLTRSSTSTRQPAASCTLSSRRPPSAPPPPPLRATRPSSQTSTRRPSSATRSSRRTSLRSTARRTRRCSTCEGTPRCSGLSSRRQVAGPVTPPVQGRACPTVINESPAMAIGKNSCLLSIACDFALNGGFDWWVTKFLFKCTGIAEMAAKSTATDVAKCLKRLRTACEALAKGDGDIAM